jgi:hypothetical protein
MRRNIRRKERNIPVGESGGRPGFPGWYLYWFFKVFSISERLIFVIIFLRLTLLVVFICAFPSKMKNWEGSFNFSTAYNISFKVPYNYIEMVTLIVNLNLYNCIRFFKIALFRTKYPLEGFLSYGDYSICGGT